MIESVLLSNGQWRIELTISRYGCARPVAQASAANLEYLRRGSLRVKGRRLGEEAEETSQHLEWFGPLRLATMASGRFGWKVTSERIVVGESCQAPRERARDEGQYRRARPGLEAPLHL